MYLELVLSQIEEGECWDKQKYHELDEDWEGEFLCLEPFYNCIACEVIRHDLSLEYWIPYQLFL